jgi:hypothetical protein
LSAHCTKILHSAVASRARRGRHFALLGAFAAVHFGLAVHTAVRRAITTHCAALHCATVHVGSRGAILHRTILHGAGAVGAALHRAALHGTASTSTSGAGRGGLGESYSAQTKGAGGGQNQFGGFHDDFK